MNLQTYLTAQYVDDAPRASYYAVAVHRAGGRWMGYFGALISEVLQNLRRDVNLSCFQSIEIRGCDNDELLHTYMPNENGIFDLSDFRE